MKIFEEIKQDELYLYIQNNKQLTRKNKQAVQCMCRSKIVPNLRSLLIICNTTYRYNSTKCAENDLGKISTSAECHNIL